MKKIINKTKLKKILKKTVLAVSFLYTPFAYAAGYQLTEHSTAGLGRSFAGAGVVGDDYSAVAYNPAGMQLVKTNGAQAGFTTVGIRSKVRGTVDVVNPVEGEGSTDGYAVSVLPAVFSQYRLSDKAVLGIGLYTPFGLGTDYDNNWFGRTHALLSEVEVFNIGPALSYQITDWLTVGAALNVQYLTAKLTSIREEPMSFGYVDTGLKTEISGEDVGLSYLLGIMVEPFSGTRLGISYRPEVKHKLDGNLLINGAHFYNAKAKVSTPQSITFSLNQTVTDKLSVSATARWTKWEVFDKLDVTHAETGGMLSHTDEKWKNTWFYSIGADYALNKNWTLRIGGAYDQSTIRSSLYRTARIPDGRRLWTSFGLSWKVGNWTLDGGYAHLFVKNVTARGGSTPHSDIAIKYSSNANLFSFSAQYNF